MIQLSRTGQKKDCIHYINHLAYAMISFDSCFAHHVSYKVVEENNNRVCVNIGTV